MRGVREWLGLGVAAVARASRFHLAVRLAGLLAALLAAGLVVAVGGGGGSMLLGPLAGLALAGGVLPGGPASRACGVAVLALWLVTRAVPPAVVAALVVLVWLCHRLGCWADVGPAHGEVDAAAVRLLVRDAGVEALWVAALCAVLLAGDRLARVLPASGAWAWLLLVVAAAGVLGWLARRGQQRPTG